MPGKLLLLIGLFSISLQAEVTNQTAFDGPPSDLEMSLYKPHAGLILGAALPDGSRKLGFEFGITAGSRFYSDVPVIFGLEFSTAEYGGRDNAEDFRRTNFFFKAIYEFRAYRLRNLYAGLALGPTYERAGLKDDVFFSLSPQAGLEFPLRKKLSGDISLGAEVRYLISTSSFPDAVSTHATMKYWF